MADFAADTIDPEEFDRLRSDFLEHVPDFGDFGDHVGVYWDQEREYKEHIRILVSGLLPRELFADPDSPTAAAGVVHAARTALTRRVRTGGVTTPQNLMSWEYHDFLKRLVGDEKRRFAAALGELLYGSGDPPERVGRFTDQVWNLYRPSPGNMPYAQSRMFPTFFLMFTDPLSNIAVRTTMFDSASKRLLGRSVLSAEPFRAAGYREVLAFSDAIFRQLQSWAWRPRDLIDVHSFLWIVTEARSRRSKNPNA
jgi:hypothetical protein